MKTNFIALGLCCISMVLAGCVETLDGKHEGGFPFAKDTVEGRYNRTVEEVMKAARDTIRYNGVLTVENVVGKTLEGKVDKRNVWVAVASVASNLTSVAVQVRTSGGGTDMELASNLKEQMAVRLATGNFTPATDPSRPAAK
jgi:hypothetical protein